MTKKLVSFDDQAEPGEGLPAAVKAELNNTYGPDVMHEVIGVEAESPSGLIARKGGKTKTDGQNVENLRRPTLVVDRMYPESRADHVIVYVDEAVRLAYSIGRDHKFRAAEWVNAPDMATFWQPARSTAPDGCVWANNFFMRESTTGALLMDQIDTTTGLTSVIRSTDAGFTWTTVFTYPNVKYPLGPQSIAQDPVTGYLYLPEYHWQVSATTADIWRSTDAGVTWQVWVSMPRHNSNPGTIRHWHSARWDPVSQRMYFTAGDMNDIGGIYRATADGSGVEPVILNNQLEWNVYFPGIGYPARAVDVMFFPTHIAWGNDGGAGSSGQNYVYRMARSEIGKANPVVEQVAAIDNTGWYCQNASSDGSTWILSSSNETGGGPNPDEGVAHLYAVTDNGSRVDEVAAVVMDGTGANTPSVAGFGNGGGQGNAFWLRAINYSPTRTGGGTHLQSAFQMRGRIAYGVVPLIKPVVANKLSYRDEHFNWHGSLAPGETRAFAHATVPQLTTRTLIYNYGHRMVNPAATPTIVLEVNNDSTNQVVFTSTGPTVRDSRWVHPTAEFLTEILGLSPGAQLLFRVRNTSTEAVADGLAHISIGFGFPT